MQTRAAHFSNEARLGMAECTERRKFNQSGAICTESLAWLLWTMSSYYGHEDDKNLVRKVMIMVTMKLPYGLGLAIGLAGIVPLTGTQAQDKSVAADAALIAKVDKRVQAWQPTHEERLLDDIAWAKDLRDALRLAKDNGRPVFLFTYSGCAEREHAIALQRC
jgi:hypothetical protein